MFEKSALESYFCVLQHLLKVHDPPTGDIDDASRSGGKLVISPSVATGGFRVVESSVCTVCNVAVRNVA